MLNRIYPQLLLCCLIFALSGSAVCTAKERGKDQYRTTQLELQSQLMSFADQLAVILGQAQYEVSAAQPELKVRALVRNDFTYSVGSAFTIAAGANPEIGLLDMVVMVTLGRMIYEERWRKELGEIIQPMLSAFKKLEADIWSVASKVLSPSEQENLRNLIKKWRRDNPKQFLFSHIRFTDFATDRLKGGPEEGEKPAGLFKSVKQATESVDKMVLLAERALYLSGRLPLLVNSVAQMGVMSTLGIKEIQQIQSDANTLAESMSRLADASEKLPGDLLKDLMSEEKRLRGLLADLNKTITAGNEFMASANTTLSTASDVATRLGLDQSSTQGKLVDPVAWTNFVDHLNTFSESIGQLLESPGWKERMPEIIQIVERVEQLEENLVDRAFTRTLVLILILLFGGVLAALLYRYVSRKVLA